MFWRLMSGLLASVVLAWAVKAQPVAFQEGRDFVTIAPAQATLAPKGSVEVIEFFSYYCPHCANFDPRLSEWVKQLPKDVVFRRVPVAFQPTWATGARLYYALEATQQLDKLHAAVFKAIHTDHRQILADGPSLEAWVTQMGGDANALKAVWNGFAVQTQIGKAQQAATAFQIPAVPILAVDGQYLPTEDFHGDPLLLANFLIAKARSDKAARK